MKKTHAGKCMNKGARAIPIVSTRATRSSANGQKRKADRFHPGRCHGIIGDMKMTGPCHLAGSLTVDESCGGGGGDGGGGDGGGGDGGGGGGGD
ncbi:hypothetical protein CDV31_002011 [Fusarium ambrosium]|uniref:Uncharacterized protein n=1 Tax=Fusarium ambrosium TaxID=131363 RepID=A0A428UXZ3_9HYPO|nr:hypothetical protein CDV31_002011 [Fusarium ambrosium]